MNDNKKAIEILKLYKQRLEESVSTELGNDIQAFEMAISALENNYNSKENNDKMQDSAIKVDLISRQAVITMLQKIENAVEDGDGFKFNEWVKYAKGIPSAENVASWVELDDYPNEDWECDHCGYIITGIEEPYRFCPNCGKKMWK